MNTKVVNTSFIKDSAERYILSLCLQNSDNYIEVAAKLSADDFLYESNRHIFNVISYLYKGGYTKFDITSVCAALEDIEKLSDVGGYSFIDALFCAPVNKDNLDVQVNKVLDSSTLYKLYNLLETKKSSIVRSASVGKSSTSVIADLEASIMNISLNTMRIEDSKILYDGLEERIEQLLNNPEKSLGIKVGFPIVDKILNGFMDGRLYIVAARPKVGKSTLLNNWALNMCKQGKRILYFDTEMLFDEFQLRSISNISGVPERIIEAGKFGNKEIYIEAIKSAIKKVYGFSLYHKYIPGFKIDDVVSIAKKHKARDNIDAVFFDYIKMVELNENFNETQTLGYITMALKDLAGSLGVPVISAVQLNRESEGKSFISSKNIADSDRVLRYCNVLMGLAPKTRKEIEEDGLMSGTHRLQVLENRGGPSFRVGVDLDVERIILTIKEAAKQSPKAEQEQSKLGLEI